MPVLKSTRIAQELSGKEAYQWFRNREYRDIPPYFLTHWRTGKKFFCAHGGLLAYEESGDQLVVAGEPLYASGDYSSLDSQWGGSDVKMAGSSLYAVFEEFARRQRKGICGYYVGQGWRASGFKKIQVGVSRVIDLDHYQQDLPQFREVRRSLRVGLRKGYRVKTIDKNNSVEVERLRRLTHRWRRKKRNVDVKFFLSDPQAISLASDYEEGFVVEYEGEFFAYCSLLPFLKDGELSFYIDHLIHHPYRESHALSYLISFIIETLASEGIYQLNFGLCPFAETSFKKAGWIEKLFYGLYRWPLFYQAKGLHYFKKKFGGRDEPEFCFFNEKKNRLSQLSKMFQVTVEGRSLRPL